MSTELTPNDCAFTLTAEQDDIPVRGNAMASGDDEVDRAEEDRILNELDDGNVWAWASVTLTCTFGGFEGFDSLGACSYRDEDDFKQPGGYYEDMREQAFENLVAIMGEAADTLKSAGIL